LCVTKDEAKIYDLADAILRSSPNVTMGMAGDFKSLDYTLRY